MDPFLGEIRAFAFNRIPRGWLLCNGSLLAVNTNQALFALLGVRYGGNGTTNFALPDLRGRAPLGYGGSVAIGLSSGTETVTLTAGEIPQHTHKVMGNGTAATTNAPAGSSMAEAASGLNAYGSPTNHYMAPAAVERIGGSLPHQNMQPSLVVSWCIASSGIYPSRS